MPNLLENTDPLLYDLDYSNISPGQQAQINALITVSSELIEKYCNRIFLSDTYVEEKLDGKGDNSLFIKNPPLISLDTVIITSAGELGDEEVYDGAYFGFDEKTGEIQWDNNYLLNNIVTDWIGHFPVGFGNIRLTYEGGFVEVPAPIKFACADIINAGFSPEMAFGNVEMEKLGQYFYKLRKEQIDKSLLSHRNILNLYKIHRA